MKINKLKLSIAMANRCMNSKDLQIASNIPRPTLNNVIAGRSVRPGTLGKVARALNCKVEELIEM